MPDDEIITVPDPLTGTGYVSGEPTLIAALAETLRRWDLARDRQQQLIDRCDQYERDRVELIEIAEVRRYLKGEQ